MFTCASCGDDTETKHLSKASLDKAGTETRKQALLVLPEIDLVCQWCDDLSEDEDSVGDDLANYVIDGSYVSDLTQNERRYLYI